ncbi:MAG: hypothetical protein WCE44_04655 [Candidatus Velthaea sp.]|jgi:hypothetical protein
MANQTGVHVQVKDNVSLENLHAIVAKVVGLRGCPTCGIAGYDIRLSGDPVESAALASAQGVKSVSSF